MLSIFLQVLPVPYFRSNKGYLACIGKRRRAAALQIVKKRLALEFEEEGGERRKSEQEGVRAVLRWRGFGVEAAEVAKAGAAVVGRVCVEDFLVEAGFRDADAVVAANDRSAIQNGDEKFFAIAAAANERDDAVVGIVAVNPFKTGPFEIDLMKRGLRGVKMI